MRLKLQIPNCFGQLWLRVCADIALLAGFRTHMTKPREGQWVTCHWILYNSLALVIKLTDNYWTLCMDMYILRGSKEKAMAPHSSTLAWKIPWVEEPGKLQSMGLLRVGHDWATSLSLFTFMHWRRKWQPTPVFLPGESQGRGSLVGCRLWSCME